MTGPSSDAVEPRRVRAVILVEGLSDRRAVEAVAARRGRDLEAEGVQVAAMDGAMNIGRSLARLRAGSGVAIAGLYDVAEEGEIRRGLEREGFSVGPSRDDIEAHGFYACVDDLEDELIRANGPDAVIELIRARGELGPFRTLTKQPEWRGRPVELQLRRFLGNASRKIEYAPLLVEALDLARIPRPLDAVVAHV